MNAIIYARVSTNDQDTTRQVNDLKRYAISNNLNVVEVFQDKISGYKKGFNERDSWNDMFQYIESNDITNILVSELSRITRRQIDLLVFVRECSSKGICIHTQKESIRTLNEDGSENSNASMLISIISSMAQEESKSLSYRIKSGRRNAILNGRGFSTKVYAYESDEDGKPKIIEEQAIVVQRIFNLACDGIGAPSIVNLLNEPLQDKTWKKGRVSSILLNTMYYGKMLYNDEFYDVPAIITKDLYDKAQEFRKSRSRFSSKRQHTNPFSSIIHCVCGSTMNQRVVQFNNTYNCNAKCGIKGVNRPFLIEEVRVIGEANAKLSQEESVRTRMSDSLTIEKANLSTLESSLRKAISKKDRNYELYLDGEVNKALYAKFNTKYELEIDSLSNNIAQSTKSIRSLKVELSNEIVHYSLDLDIFKKQLLNKLEYIIVHRDFVEVKFRNWFKQIVMIYRGQELIKYNNLMSKARKK